MQFSIIRIFFIVVLWDLSCFMNTQLVTQTLDRTEILNRLSKGDGYNDDDEDDYDDDDEDNDYRDERFNNGSIAHTLGLSRQRSDNIINREGITYAWGRWEKWSRCWKSCVQIRKRLCIKRIRNSTITFLPHDETFYPNSSLDIPGCFGIRKKYRLCKDDKCKVIRKYQTHNEQCAVAYNHISYQGQYFTWFSQQTINYMENYINECILHCKAKETNHSISQTHAVIDGTPCQRPAIYYSHHYRGKAACVEGICRVSLFYFIKASLLSCIKCYMFALI
uniref:ADAMTS cysteine-rich domain-containing protein n=1 Tax=Glossina brevipalpis TaxID=37001 RepID=A0A1A9W6U6_9MUSC